MTATLQSLEAIDAELVRGGHHCLTDWWRAELGRYYAAGVATFVGRVGRGGAKSHTSSKVALNEVLCGDWSIGPGERHYWAFVSARRDEADQRILLLESFLRALRVGFDRRGSTIDLRGHPRGFKVFACNVGSVSGFRCLGYSADELAKWNVEGTNPSAEVCASLNAMTVTHPGSRRILISSPLGLTDYHASRFELGDTADQVVAHAASWEANPGGITEEATHRAEPDDRVWAREYAAVPGSGVTDDWFGVGVGLSAVAPELLEPPDPWRRFWVAIDPAFSQDRFGFAVCSSVQQGDGRLTTVHEVGAWKPDRSPGEMAARVRSELGRKYGVGEDDVKVIYSDQYEGHSFVELARREGLFLQVVPWTSGSGITSKATRFRSVRMAMISGELRIPDEPGLIKRLRSVRGIILPSGGERIEVPRTLDGHGDDISALVLAVSLALGIPAQQRPVVARETDHGRDMREARLREVSARQRKDAERRGSLERRLRAVR